MSFVVESILSPGTPHLAYDVAAYDAHDFCARTCVLECSPHLVEHPRRWTLNCRT